MAASLVRGDVAYLAELAISSDVQSWGIGQRLLQSAVPDDAREH